MSNCCNSIRIFDCLCAATLIMSKPWGKCTIEVELPLSPWSILVVSFAVAGRCSYFCSTFDHFVKLKICPKLQCWSYYYYYYRCKSCKNAISSLKHKSNLNYCHNRHQLQHLWFPKCLCSTHWSTRHWNRNAN